MRQRNLTQADIKGLFHYDPHTGVFVRKKTVSSGAVAGSNAGTLVKSGYLCVNIEGARYTLHRLAFIYMTGDLPSDHTDHINGVKTDNRWCNLRAVCQADNNRNVKRKKNNTSGVNGVHWSKTKNKWCAQIKVSGKTRHIGRYDNFLVACGYRKIAEEQYGYHPNHGRVIHA